MDLDFSDFGLVRRRDLRLSDGALGRAVASGRLHRLYADVYATTDCTLEPAVARRRAALVYAGDDARLSCLSACAEWQILQPSCETVHITTENRQVRGARLLKAHRRRRWVETQKNDVLVSPLADAVVEAFGCLSKLGRRQLLITAVGRGFVTPDAVRTSAVPGSRGRPALLALLEEVAGGSHSEGELALLSLMRAAGLPEPTRQLRVQLGRRSAYLDMAFEACRVVIEVDSRRWHFSAEARAADLRRDAWLAAAGWVVLRFLYEQIVNEPTWVVDRIRATLAARSPAA
jgi:very-short-patch-repair endonuclease